MATQQFVAGRKYRLVTRVGMQKRERIQILRFVGRDDFTKDLHFDAYPIAGRQVFRPDNIFSADMVADATAISLDSMAPSRGR